MSRTRLEAAVLAAMDQAGHDVMRWGEDDCALWFANTIRDALGYDPAAWFRGRYHSRFGAMRLMAAHGGLQGMLRAAARRHDWQQIDPAFAKVGDPGLTWTVAEGRVVLATCICRAPGWFVARNERGFTTVAACDVVAAWSVLPDWMPGKRCNLHSSVKLVSQPVHEPVSTFIGLTALISGTFGVTTAVAGAIGGFIISTATSIAFSLAASLLQPQRGQNATAGSLNQSNTQTSVQITERQSLPYKTIVVGNAYLSGALFFEEVTPPFLTHGIAINHGEISGVKGITIGTDKLAFNNISAGTILTPSSIDGQPNYAGNMRVCVRYGAEDQAADPLILAKYPNVGSDFRQRGIATYVGEYNFGGSTQEAFLALWGQVSRPAPRLSVDGVKVYDPRDPTQNIDDPSTWKWTNNASLIQAWYLTRPFGGRISASKIDWAKVADAANYDDEVIGCKDGTFIKRHTIDGVIKLNEKPYSVLPRLLTANRGYVLESAGKVWVSSSRPKAPTFTINDKLIAGGFKYQSAKAKRELINKLQVRFVAEEQDYQIVDGPILDRTDLQTTDREVLPGTLQLDFTRDYRRAERLQKAYLDSSRLGKTVTVPVDANLLAIASDDLIGSVGNVDSDLWPIINAQYFVTGVGFSEDFSTLMLALTEYDGTIETAWDPTVDETEFTLASVNTE